MASIVGKRIGGQTYYYLREVARVGGKPKIVAQHYLGKAEDIQAAVSGATVVPDRTRHLAFGDLAAAWEVIRRLGVVDSIDELVGSRRSDAAASVGTYIALATVNRVVAPCSKLAFADWWQTTAGDRWVRLGPGALDHRRFWDAMDALSAAVVRQAERAITARMVAGYGVDVSGLVLDMTNFATWVDSGNARNTIARRGKSKQHRADLRLVGLGLIVSTDGGVPLVSHPYPGNRPDVTQFGALVDELLGRWEALAADDGADLTIVYDAGQDSTANQALIARSPLHFVGSLPPSDHPSLLAVPTSRYRKVDPDAFPGLRAYDTHVSALGGTWRAVCTHSAELHAKQARGLEQTLAKAYRRLDELKARLERGKTRRQRPAVQAEIARIVADRWVARVLHTTLHGDTPASLRLDWQSDAHARQALEAELFGKRILFTDRADWTVAQVVAAYRSQEEVEADFRQMKDPKVVSFQPMYHWTDQKVVVHAFYCTLALAVARLLRREAARAGLAMSVRELLGHLGGIQETVLLYQGQRGRPRARRMLTELTPIQARLYDLFGLHTYAPPSQP
ncbi:MAG TPA: IS1634 family transposase [Actinomycetes bacterium]|jgi:transposase|nr:IS1634 family transposase [Actinomycetes bacterium]